MGRTRWRGNGDAFSSAIRPMRCRADRCDVVRFDVGVMDAAVARDNRASVGVTARGNTIMSRIRRGGYVFVTWVGDHGPRHVHVYRDGRLVMKWNLDDRRPIKGRGDARVLQLIDELVEEGLL